MKFASAVPRLSFALLAALGGACSSNKAADAVGVPGADAGANAAAVVVTPGSFSLEVPCTDAPDSVYGDPGALPAEKGAIIKCGKLKDLTKDELTAAVPAYTGKPLTSGAHVYRVLYRTERGDDANTPGYSSALVYVPDAPRVAPAGGKLLPVVVTSHGTKGQGPKCASSMNDVDAYMNYPLVGAGYALIAPDLAGYANFGAPNNPPSAYASAADVGKSTLDGARALRKMFPSSVSDKVVLVGHSQGGGTALGGLVYSDTYGSGGTVVGVVAYAPLWLSQATWGALPLEATTYPFVGNELVNAVAVWYLYGHGELLDGPGHGGDVFNAASREAIKNFVTTTCYPDLTPIDALGKNITDVYDGSFSSSLATAAAFGAACSDAVCAKWKARMNADRPHLTGASNQVPILLAYGGKDTTIPPERMSCVIDHFDGDKTNYKLCYEPDATHAGVVGVRSSYAADWIGARALGEPEPAACTAPFAKPACAAPPPNEWL